YTTAGQRGREKSRTVLFLCALGVFARKRSCAQRRQERKDAAQTPSQPSAYDKCNRAALAGVDLSDCWFFRAVALCLTCTFATVCDNSSPIFPSGIPVATRFTH